MTTIKLEKFIQVNSSEVYTYFTNSTALRDWMCDVATVDAHPGGHLFLSWEDGYYTSGEFVKLEKDKFISFTWFSRGEPHQSLVEINLRKSKKGTQLRLTHKNIGKGDKWAGIAEGYEKEWQSAIENLASVLGEGPDLRITRRPMIGIIVDDFNAEIAVKMGIPTEYGLRVGGIVDGMGAQRAGLQADDVITMVDGQEITADLTFGSIISKKHAGDNVDVSFYRAGQRKSTMMTLSGRPLPTVPTSSAMFRKQLEPIYQQYEAKIDELLQDATEEECAARPRTGEWSVNEVLAHLIHSEVGWQNVMSEMIGGYEGLYDGYGGNIQAHIDGTIATFPSKVKLLDEFKIHNAETLNMISCLPGEFLMRKGKFWKLVYAASQNSYHLQTHLEQIQNAISAARNN